MKNLKYILLSGVALAFGACDYLEVDPVGKVIPTRVSEYRALLTTGYSSYPETNRAAITALSDEGAALNTSDLLESTALTFEQYSRWEYTNISREFDYQLFYKAIFHANAVLEGLPAADDDSSIESKEQLSAEAYALRAMCHFELVNMYAKWYDPATAASDKGIVISDYIDITQVYAPSSVAEVYAHILADLNSSLELMQVDAPESTEYAYRFNRRSVIALKARVELYMQDWAGALASANSILAELTLQDLNQEVVDSVYPWSEESVETILALDKPFDLYGGDLIRATRLSSHIVGLYDQAGDKRWCITGSEGDYAVDRSVRDDVMYTSIRTAEIYLIAAEAAARGNDLAQARTHLSALQAKRMTAEVAAAKKTAVDAMSQTELIAEIMDERAREFLVEGHRWFDLKRTTRPQITKSVQGQSVTLQPNDPRYVMTFPDSAIENNAELNK